MSLLVTARFDGDQLQIEVAQDQGLGHAGRERRGRQAVVQQQHVHQLRVPC